MNGNLKGCERTEERGEMNDGVEAIREKRYAPKAERGLTRREKRDDMLWRGPTTKREERLERWPKGREMQEPRSQRATDKRQRKPTTIKSRNELNLKRYQTGDTREGEQETRAQGDEQQMQGMVW